MNFITLLWISMEKHSNIHSVKKRAIKKGCPMDSLVRKIISDMFFTSYKT